MGKRAVFLDRDGTIAQDVDFCCRVDDFEILPRVPQAIGLLNRRGFMVIVVTNQSGLYRGFFTEETLMEIHRHMKRELAERGATVDDVFYCSHGPDDGCDCRKPNPGLLFQAARNHGIDLTRSFMVGDADRDVLAGRDAGCRTALISSNGRGREASPDHVAPDLLQAVRWIVTQAADSEQVEAPIDSTVHSHPSDSTHCKSEGVSVIDEAGSLPTGSRRNVRRTS